MKRIISVLIILTLVAGICFAQTNEEAIKAEALAKAQAAADAKISPVLNSFTGTIADYIPDTAAQQNIWADAYIGKVFPSFPPHFGAGFSVGGSLIQSDFIAKAFSAMGSPIDINNIFLPTVTVDARVGGLFLPFDIGVHAMKLDPIDLNAGPLGFKAGFMTYGADLRYCVLEPNLILPAISVGASFTHSEGSFAMNASNTNTEIKYDTNIFAFTAQISKSILIATPFVGARAVYQVGNYNWDANFKYDYDGATYTIDLNNTIEKTFDMADGNYMLFAGVGLNFFVIQTTVTATYDINKGNFAGALSIHAKL